MILTILFPEYYNNNIEMYIADLKSNNSIETIYCISQFKIYNRIEKYCKQNGIFIVGVLMDNNDIKNPNNISKTFKKLSAVSDKVLIFSRTNLKITNLMIQNCKKHNTRFLFIQHFDSLNKLLDF